ncbi:hypothetical protein, partial [Bacteroides congonensis]|uniref:hypothetical protein n=1 Tax=Bacteroides congonensis TaxID=1871006 RepID=UPI00321BEFAF
FLLPRRLTPAAGGWCVPQSPWSHSSVLPPGLWALPLSSFMYHLKYQRVTAIVQSSSLIQHEFY